MGIEKQRYFFTGLFVGCLAVLLGCGADNSSSSTNPFDNSRWNVTFTGACDGTGEMIIENTGLFYFSSLVELKPGCGYLVNGGVSSKGTIEGGISDANELWIGSFHGTLSRISGNGTWQTNLQKSGTWSAIKIQN